MPQVKRPVGRPPIENPAVKRVAVKVTPEQHAAWLALGASRWLKEILDRHISQKREDFVDIIFRESEQMPNPLGKLKITSPKSTQHKWESDGHAVSASTRGQREKKSK